MARVLQGVLPCGDPMLLSPGPLQELNSPETESARKSRLNLFPMKPWSCAMVPCPHWDLGTIPLTSPLPLWPSALSLLGHSGTQVVLWHHGGEAQGGIWTPLPTIYLLSALGVHSTGSLA